MTDSEEKEKDMAYLNLDLDYFQHRKVVRLIGMLGRNAEVLPIRLWCYCGKYHAENGRLTGYSTREIESIAGWWGKEGEMIKAMRNVRLIIKIKDGYEVNNWLEHEGHLCLFKKRAVEAAQKRWGDSNAISNAKGEVKQCSYYTNHTNQDPYSPQGDGYSDGFLEFWRIYPKKVGKKAAWRAWKRAKAGPELAVKIAESVKKHISSATWMKEGGEFIPHPATFLNQGRWEDEIFEKKMAGGVEENPHKRMFKIEKEEEPTPSAVADTPPVEGIKEGGEDGKERDIQ